MLVLVVLHAATTFGPAASAAPRSTESTSTWAQAHTKQSQTLCQESFSISQELSLQSERQSKKVRTLTRCLVASLHEPSYERYLHSSTVATVPPARRVFHRKLSPPSAIDDPFVS